MRKKRIAGNWKMHGTQASVRALAQALQAGSQALVADITVFPASVHLNAVAAALQGSRITLGAQNLYPGEAGAFTGEISAAMLKDAGCHAVLVGHSERRQLFHEDPLLVAEKFQAARSVGLIPFLCVGETREAREAGQTESVIAAQLAPVLSRAGKNGFEGAVIAYEPVWAIGTGLTATPDQAQAVHAFIRQWLARQNTDIAKKIQILYGGSVRAGSAAALFAMPDVDGALVGGASLKAEEFLAICAATG